jgi:hypothetical protein
MTTARNPTKESLFPDKARLRRLAAEQDRQAGITFDPTATPEKVRELMRACGVRPEENLFSRDILRVKYPDEDA